MNGQRALAAAVVAWLAVVAVASGLVWVVISRAGDDLVAAGQPGAASSPGTAAPSDRDTPRPTRKPRATSSPSSSGSATPEPTGTSTGTPTATPTSDPTGQQTSSPPAPSVVQRTWQGAAGTVVAACQDGVARLVSAQPATGFRAEASGEDGALSVEFEGREDRSGTDVRVVARCAGGVPTFSVESRESSEGSDD